VQVQKQAFSHPELPLRDLGNPQSEDKRPALNEKSTVETVNAIYVFNAGRACA
jgi:hypothetical protein